MCGRIAQQRLELGKSQFDWVEVGRGGLEGEEPRSNRLDALADATDLVGCSVVQDDGVAGLEGRGENVSHVGAEGLVVHGTVEQLGCSHAAGAQQAFGAGQPVGMDRGCAHRDADGGHRFAHGIEEGGA